MDEGEGSLLIRRLDGCPAERDDVGQESETATGRGGQGGRDRQGMWVGGERQ